MVFGTLSIITSFFWAGKLGESSGGAEMETKRVFFFKHVKSLVLLNPGGEIHVLSKHADSSHPEPDGEQFCLTQPGILNTLLKTNICLLPS